MGELSSELCVLQEVLKFFKAGSVAVRYMLRKKNVQ